MRVPVPPVLTVRLFGIVLGAASVLLLQPVVFVDPGGLFGLATTTLFFMIPYGLATAAFGAYAKKMRKKE